ncbi:MAG TPA: hypothetical protein PLJ21_06740 [Pseudobdellovibrionaceae bacterium]|nr:hypothetical protein [Pseudobdellovibrionaceae bacterium]
MSEETKTTSSPTKIEETDSSSLLLDEAAPQHLFILKNSDNSLKGAEQFLKNRGWKIASATHLKKALLYIIQNLPTFVMISSDHSHPKVKILPKLLKQVLPIHVIGFAESQMTSSNLNLDAMKLEYALFAPVSGPQILRIVTLIIREHNKSLKEAPEEKEHSQSNTENSGKEDSNLVTIKGGKKPSRDPLSLQKAREALQKAFASDDTDPSGGDASFFLPESPTSSIQTSELTPNITKDLQSNSDHLEELVRTPLFYF